MKIRALTNLHISLTVLLVTTIIAADKASGIVHRNGALICIMLGIVGLVLWLTGGFAALSRRSESWGLIFMLSAAAVSPFITNYVPQPVVVARARPSAAMSNAAAAIVFPPLNLQGITFQGQKSSALINGRVLYVGEGIGNVRIVAIEASRVTVELDGHTKVLSLKQ